MQNVSETAKKWQISERSVRDYCATGKIPGAIQKYGAWLIPNTAKKPARKNAKNIVPAKTTNGTKSATVASLLKILRREDDLHIKGGIYHKVQIDLTYNSNHIEGSRLTHDQTRYIFETHTIAPQLDARFAAIKVDDIVETANHFRCVDYIIENANRAVSASMLKNLHFMLKNGTTDSLQDWFATGDYKKYPNEVGGFPTTPPHQVKDELTGLLAWYNALENPDFDDILEFHFCLERIHPFQDGNGRVGRLILFKECLRLGIVPFIITDDLKLFYYRGLKQWRHEKGYLRDTCLHAQDEFKKILDYFEIGY